MDRPPEAEYRHPVWRACVALLLTGCSFHFNPATPASDGARDGVARDGSADPVHDAPAGSPALVQQAIASANNTNSPLTATLPAQPASGDLLVMIGAAEHGGLTSVSGGGVTTWTRATQSLMNTNVEIWYGITDGSSAAVTVTFPAVNLPIWQLVTEWSGTAAANVLDASASISGTSSPAGAGGVAAAARELVVFAVADQTPNTFGTPAPSTWTALMPVTSNATAQQAWYAVATTTGSIAPSVTETNHSWDAAIASFHAAP